MRVQCDKCKGTGKVAIIPNPNIPTTWQEEECPKCHCRGHIEETPKDETKTTS